MIQKKVGIRLRHLEGPSQTSRYPNIGAIEQPSIDQSRRRSPSPLNRRKIFAKSNEQYQQTQQMLHHKPPLQNHRPIQNHRQNNNFGSPLMNAQYNSHSNTNLNEYQSQVERLIQSLKKKSIQLEKKEQIITKLRREIQILKAQNGTFMQQIKTLKAQLQFERISATRNQPQIVQSSRLNKNIRNQQEYSMGLKNRYNNQPYQQFAPTPDRQPQQNYNPNNARDNRSIANPNRSGLPEQKIKRNHMEMPIKQQDSIMSDYLSPLMVLNQPTSKNPSPIPFNEKQKSIGSKSIKSNSRIQYDAPQRQQQAPPKNFDEQRFNIRPNNSQNNLYSSQNPFSKKNFYQQNLTRETQSPPKFGYETTGHYQDRPQNTQNYSRGQAQKRWPTLQSSAAHFNTNFLQQVSPQSRNPRKESPFYKKQLTIQDSKQFRFEDFDFSQLDNSQMSNF